MVGLADRLAPAVVLLLVVDGLHLKRVLRWVHHGSHGSLVQVGLDHLDFPLRYAAFHVISICLWQERVQLDTAFLQRRWLFLQNRRSACSLQSVAQAEAGASLAWVSQTSEAEPSAVDSSPHAGERLPAYGQHLLRVEIPGQGRCPLMIQSPEMIQLQ